MSEQFGPNTYYYWGIIKQTTISFLDLFNEFKVRRWKKDGTVKKEVAVPILFGPMERGSYVNAKGKTVQRVIRVPMIHIALSNLEVDTERAFSMKSEKYMHHWANRPNEEYYNYASLLPYPYNYTYNMTIIAKYQEDLMQLIEQIVPLFNYHRVIKYRHPKFRDIKMSNWVNITDYPTFDFNNEYDADDRRGLLAVPITFKIEGWLVREIYDYTNFNVITEIISNYVVANQRVLKHQIIGDTKIQLMTFDRIKNGEFKEGDILIGQRNNYQATVISIGVSPLRADYVIKKTIKPNSIILTEDPEWEAGTQFIVTGTTNGDNNGEYVVKEIEKIEDTGVFYWKITTEEYETVDDLVGSGVATSAYDYYGENYEYDDRVGVQDKQVSYDIESTTSPNIVEFKVGLEDWLVGDQFVISASSHNNNGVYTIEAIDGKIISVVENTIDTNVSPTGNGYGTDLASYYTIYQTNYIIIKFDGEDQTYFANEDIHVNGEFKTKCNLCRFWDGNLESIYTDHPKDEAGIWPNEGSSLNIFR